MIYVHSLGRAARYFPERTALAGNGTRSTFRELHDRVGRIAVALTKHGFKAGDRLAILLPNESDYLELVYACAWLGVIAVPLNTRLSVKEIDGILDDAKPRGLIRHSSLPVPALQVSWQLVLDQDPFDVQSDSVPNPIYDPDAILALIYTSGTTGRPKASRSGMQVFWRTSITPTSGSRLKKVRCIYMPRRFFTLRTFRSCSPRRLSAPVRSRSQNLIPKRFAKLSNANASRTRCWCRQ
jgi:acyl-coenzyme A synthetase/AMP-(fatty) acid ligase